MGIKGFMTTIEAAEKWGITQRRVLELIWSERITDVSKVGTVYIMPADTPKPPDLRKTRYSKNKEKRGMDNE